MGRARRPCLKRGASASRRPSAAAAAAAAPNDLPAFTSRLLPQRFAHGGTFLSVPVSVQTDSAASL